MATKVKHTKATLDLQRLAFSMEETAELLGVSYQTVWRLNKRGLIRSSSALRHKLFSKTEIERFLQSTTGANT